MTAERTRRIKQGKSARASVCDLKGARYRAAIKFAELRLHRETIGGRHRKIVCRRCSAVAAPRWCRSVVVSAAFLRARPRPYPHHIEPCRLWWPKITALLQAPARGLFRSPDRPAFARCNLARQSRQDTEHALDAARDGLTHRPGCSVDTVTDPATAERRRVGQRLSADSEGGRDKRTGIFPATGVYAKIAQRRVTANIAIDWAGQRRAVRRRRETTLRR